jgi:alpha-1,3-mannosyltransferase
MRIAHVTRQFTPAVGGLENVVHNLARAQLSGGRQVRVITLNRDFARPDLVLPARENIEGIDVVRLPYRGSRRYPIAPTVLCHIKGADIVHVHAIDFFFDFLALTSPWHRQPLVVTPHGAFFHTRFAARLKLIYFHTVTRVLLRAYRAVINVSRHDHEPVPTDQTAGRGVVEQRGHRGEVLGSKRRSSMQENHRHQSVFVKQAA